MPFDDYGCYPFDQHALWSLASCWGRAFHCQVRHEQGLGVPAITSGRGVNQHYQFCDAFGTPLDVSDQGHQNYLRVWMLCNQGVYWKIPIWSEFQFSLQGSTNIQVLRHCVSGFVSVRDTDSLSTSGSRKWTLSANARVLLCPLKEGFQRTARCTAPIVCGARRSSGNPEVHKKMTQNGYPTFDGDEKSTLLKKVQTKDAREWEMDAVKVEGKKPSFCMNFGSDHM